jgi:hypothetical protein
VVVVKRVAAALKVDTEDLIRGQKLREGQVSTLSIKVIKNIMGITPKLY